MQKTRSSKMIALVNKFFGATLFGAMYLGLGAFSASFAAAQTQIHISGPQSGFPIAVPQLCDSGGAGDTARRIPEVVAKDLELSAVFKVINPGAYVESAGRCSNLKNVAFSDWSVIGAEWLIKGNITVNGDTFNAELYLFDVPQQRAVLAKAYEASVEDYRRVAHRFANAVLGVVTGEKGAFGSQMVFTSKVGRFKELFIAELDGSEMRQLTKDKGIAVSPSWHTSGQKIVYTSYRTRKPELFTISPEGGSPRQMTKREGLEIGAKYMRDGESVITSAIVNGNSNIVILDGDGSVQRQVTRGSVIDVSPSLSPDGSKFAFCSNRGGGPQIYVASVSNPEDARRISFTSSNYCTSPAWSPKGDKIAFVCRDQGFQLYITSPGGERPTQLTYVGINEDPNWSPDGRYLLFSSNGGGGPRGIYLLPLITGVPKRITSSRTDDGQPVWGPVPD